MATRIYQRQPMPSCNPRQLASLIDVALSRIGHTVEIDQLDVFVSHNLLTPDDDAAIQTVIANYVYDDNFDLPSEDKNLKGMISALNQWAQDATNALAVWDGQTTAQRFATVKIVIQRFGLLSARMADVLKVLKRGD